MNYEINQKGVLENVIGVANGVAKAYEEKVAELQQQNSELSAKLAEMGADYKVLLEEYVETKNKLDASTPAQRITEQDAREIVEMLRQDYIEKHTGESIEAFSIRNLTMRWLDGCERLLLAKLNEKREPAEIEWNAQCSCGHRWLFESPTENCPKCRLVTANKAEVPRWNPIETMPISQEVLVYCDGAECVGLAWKTDDGKVIVPEVQAIGFDSLTHWMPLPLPPLKDGE